MRRFSCGDTKEGTPVTDRHFRMEAIVLAPDALPKLVQVGSTQKKFCRVSWLFCLCKKTLHHASFLRLLVFLLRWMGLSFRNVSIGAFTRLATSSSISSRGFGHFDRLALAGISKAP